MNVEGFFVRTLSTLALREIVLRRLNSADDTPGSQPDWGLQTSYDAFIVGNAKRKIALSKPKSGWVAGIESKEVLDFSLLLEIGQSLATDVVAYQLSEITGGWGYAVYSNGRVEKSHFEEDAADPFAATRTSIGQLGIPFDLVMFREAAEDKTGNWEVIQRSV